MRLEADKDAPQRLGRHDESSCDKPVAIVTRLFSQFQIDRIVVWLHLNFENIGCCVFFRNFFFSPRYKLTLLIVRRLLESRKNDSVFSDFRAGSI